jgi:hypothetical protein
MKPIIFTFEVDVPSELSAGIRGFTDTIKVTVESGAPCGEPGEFETFMEDCLKEWYDTRGVECTNKRQKEITK